MATVALPDVPPDGAEPVLMDWGGPQRPMLGGATTWVARLGSRFAVRFTLPALTEPCARRFVALIAKARAVGDPVSMRWPQEPAGAFGTPLIDGAVSGGTAISIKGLTAAKPIAIGTMISILHGGRRFLHIVTVDAVANGSGVAAVNIAPMLRTNLAINDPVEIDEPVIEGFVSGEAVPWTVERLKEAGFAFTVEEIE